MQRERLRKFTEKALESSEEKLQKALKREDRLTDGSARMYVGIALRGAIGYGVPYAVSRLFGIQNLAALFGFIGALGAASVHLLNATKAPVTIWRRSRILENYKDELEFTPEKVKEISRDVVKALKKALPRGPERKRLLSEIKQEMDVVKGPTAVRRALDELLEVRDAAWKVVRVAKEGLKLGEFRGRELGIPDLNERAANMVRKILDEAYEERVSAADAAKQPQKEQPSMARTVIGRKLEVGETVGEISAKPAQPAQPGQTAQRGDFYGKY